MSTPNEQIVIAVIGLIDNLCDNLPRGDYLDVIHDIEAAMHERITAEDSDCDD